MSKSAKLFGTIACELSLLTEKQLAHCVRDQEARSKRGAWEKLGEVAVALGYLSPHQVTKILDLQECSLDPEPTRLFGQIALANDLLRKEDLEATLKEQEGLRNKEGKAPPIGELLVQKGILTRQQQQAILRTQSRLASAALATRQVEPLSIDDEMHEFSLTKIKKPKPKKAASPKPQSRRGHRRG